MTRARTALALISAHLLGALAGAAGAAPDSAAFNYPPPPLEGRGEFFVIAESGQTRCGIVMPAKPAIEEVRAARMLQLYLGQVTGARFAIYQENQEIPAGLGRIYVGETERAKELTLDLPPVRYGDAELPNLNGYLVKTPDAQTLILRGYTPQATVFAAVGLLKRYASVRRYWPGKPGGIGDVVPSRPTLVLPKLEWRDWPYFISRIMSGLDDRGPRSDEGRFIRFADFWRMYYTIPSNESYYRLLKTREHTDDRELFPLINGERFVPKVEEGKRIPHGWQPCVSNPKVARIMADSLIEAFRSDPRRIAMNLAVNDGLGDCTCEDCCAMDAPGADPVNRIGLCDRYVTFDNRVAELVREEFPDRILAFIAYGSMRQTPTTVQLHPMLMPVLCVGGNTFQMWDEWSRTGARHLGVYFYHDDIWFIMPKMDIHQSAKRLRYIVQSGLARHFYQEFYGIYPIDGMVGHVEAELCWNPRLNEDDLLAEHYDVFFRNAAEPMGKFYDALEAGYEAWLAQNGEPHPHGPDLSSLRGRKSLDQFAVLPVRTAEQAQEHLTRALAAARDDTQVAERVQLVKLLFDFAVFGSREYWAMQRLWNREVRTAEAAQAIVQDAREGIDNGLRLADYRHDVMEQPPAKAYADHRDRDTFYNDLERGAVHSVLLSATGDAFSRISQYLRESLGPEQASAWWRRQRETEPRPLLQALMSAAAFEAGGGTLPNLIRDPSFEERGKTQADAPAEQLPEGHQVQGGLRLWHSAGTPVCCSLTTDEAHSGEHSVVFWSTQRASVMETLPVTGGDVLRMSLWVKHNDAEATYEVTAIPRSDRMLARTSVPVPWRPDEWQKVALTFTAPPQSRTLGLYLFVHGQTPDAKVWVDDFFVGKYAE